jgi:hypothetical protein
MLRGAGARCKARRLGACPHPGLNEVKVAFDFLTAMPILDKMNTGFHKVKGACDG